MRWAIYTTSGTRVIDRCKFTDGTGASSYYSYSYQFYAMGSVMYINSGDVTITNSLFYDNNCGRTTDNGHIYIHGGTTNITNCTFTDNSSSVDGLIYCAGGTNTIKNCILWKFLSRCS